MGGKSVGPVEQGFLDVPSWTLAGILFFFLVVSLAFERGTHWLILKLKKRKRNGLAVAVSNLMLELTLVGLVSLLLVVLQEPLSAICVPYSASTVQKWSLIGNVPGCDCCIEHTATVGSCFAESRNCGPKYCNCDYADPSCVVTVESLNELLGEWKGDASCNVSTCAAGYLERAASSPQAEVAASALQLQCDGMVKLNTDKCGEGKTQMISVTALHQVHIFIFVVAGVHVCMGVLMIILATWRLRMWRRACADDDDEHSRNVRQLLDQRKAHAKPSWRRLLEPSWRRRKTAGSGSGGSAPHGSASFDGAASPTAAAAAAADVESGAAAGEAGAVPAAGQPDSGRTSEESKLKRSASASSGSGHAPPEAEGTQGAAANGGAPAPAPLARAGSSRVIVVAPVTSLELEGGVLPPVGPQVAPPSRVSSAAFLQRSSSIKGGDWRGWVGEYFICLLHQFNPRPVSAEQLRIMRASFALTHRVPSGFDFWGYILLSMEDDFSHLVGVSLEMWLTLILFILISGLLGWVALIAVVLASTVLLVVNVKLFSVIRHVCRGARVNQLSSHIFWFNRPALLLHPVKYLLFLCSFMFASAIFFVWSFGASSCPFSNAFWFAWLPPWWVSLIIGGLIFLDASMRTLPTYSLAVQMGSDFKHHMLPTGIKTRLLKIAEHIKRKHKAQLAAAAAAEGSRRAGVLGSAQNIAQKFQNLTL